jgi:hypothetical protein
VKIDATRAILLGSATCCAGVLSWIIFNHGVYFVTPRSTLIYAGIPACVLATLLGLMVLPGRVRLYAIIAGGSILSGGYAFEFHLWHQEGSLNPQVLGARSVLDRLAAEGTPAVPPFSPPAVRIGQETIAPLGGIPLRPKAVIADTGSGYDVFLSDRAGFNNPDSLWDCPIRSVAIGDSFTYGASAASDETFVAGIGRRTGPILNLGFGGNGPFSELATLIEFASRYRPQLVLWFYYANDLEQDIFAEASDEILPRYLEPGFSQGLWQRLKDIGAALESEYRRRQALELEAKAPDRQAFDLADWLSGALGENPLNRVDGLTLRRTRTVLGLVEGGGDWPDPPKALFAKVIDAALREVRSWNGQLVFVYLPSWSEIVRGDQTKARYRDAAITVANERKIEVIDLRNAFYSHPDPRSLFPNRQPGHYGGTGHAFVADVVTEELLRMKLVPANPEMVASGAEGCETGPHAGAS